MTTHTVESTPDTVRSGYVFPAGIRDRVTAWLRPGQARP
jgi:hypothetical protein